MSSTPPDPPDAQDDRVGESSILPAPVPVTAAQGRHHRRHAPHHERFRVALAMLAGIAVGALAIAAAVVIAHHGTAPATAKSTSWSSWSPGTSGEQGVSAIADHIAPYYRFSAAQQLDVITPMALTDPNASGTVSGKGMIVAVNTGSAKAENLSLLGGHTVAYNICGLGTANCALSGKPSTSRLLLLRREALELALYTFKYIPGTDNVIALLPPGRTETTSGTFRTRHGVTAPHPATTSKPLTIAVLFVKPELQPLLSMPLKRTLAEIPPDVPELPLWARSNEAGLVDQITGHGLFSSSIENQQGVGNLLVLNSIPPQ